MEKERLRGPKDWRLHWCERGHCWQRFQQTLSQALQLQILVCFAALASSSLMVHSHSTECVGCHEGIGDINFRNTGKTLL